MDKKIIEWLKQADYDINTAEFMCSGGRFFYAVFMCHLSIEKALKGLFQQKLQELPPKTHNLVYLLNKINIRPDENIGKIITRLNEASIATRYPEDMEMLQKNYTQQIAEKILVDTKEAVEWIKKQF
ncbi:MAG: DNA-binding protein [Planctomycetes bacterium GWC2_45_44]|nr:MAG: DNA-binding protein [Planctomycetes bacterium GWC2_45_44]HBR18933.1 DNA-binding protein [Phycisphaerales bacterium]